MPDNKEKTNFKPVYQFNNMADVLRGKAITSRTFVAPIFCAKVPEKIIALAQMEIRPGATNSFEEVRDKRAF